MEDINQGNTNRCYFIGVVAAILFLAIIGMCNLPLYAQTPGALEVGLRLDPEAVKAGDQLRMMVTLHNTSAAEANVVLMIPYIAYPDIKNALTGSKASWWAPPNNGPVMPRKVLLKPGQEYPLLTYSLKITDEKVDGKGAKALSDLLRPVDWSQNADLPLNTGLMTAEPGTYSVKFKLSLEGKSMETAARTFQIKQK